MWMPPPLMVEVTTRWLADGTADRLIRDKRAIVAQRQAAVAEVLAGHGFKHHPNGYQVWLELPDPWTTDAFLTAALEKGVKMIGAGAFAISRANIPHAARLSIGLPSQKDFEHGLQTVATILSQDWSATF
jgi:DNA-binding transcriptional MocR family regulator